MSAEKEMENALGSFEDRLRSEGFALSGDARLTLRKYVMEAETKKRIFSQIERRERTPRDLVEGFSELAAVASEVALSEGRRTLTSRDINEAIKRVFCRVWPFCK